MDTLELKRLVRESYPFPIAHAHKKTLAVLDNNVEKLTGIFETAEMTIQFLAILALAQVRQDLINHKTVPNMKKLREKLNLSTPSLGKWSTIARETMKAYWNGKEQLAAPELFDVFWSWDAARQKLGTKPLNNKALAPLIELRNDFHHKRIQNHQIPNVVPTALELLHQFLAAIRFVAEYQLVFTNRILLDQDQENTYLNELMLFTGCFSAFDSDRWKSAIRLKPDAVVFLHPQTGRHLILSPFITFTNQFNGLPDLLVINSVTAKDAEYVATLFGNVAKTSQPEWSEGVKHFAALNEFVEQLRQAADSAAPDNLPPEEAAPAPVEDDVPMIRKAAAPPVAPQTQHSSPYKFLDYYNPEDADIFFGRDREIRVIEQKFHNTRLLVLHGESGTGKTSLIRAGLMPRLSPEVFVPVYVRVLHDPLREIKRELLRQLGLQDENLFDTPLADFLTIATERVSKTVIIVFDQFEEFFLRFDDEARRRVIAELAACLTTARLDVKFLIAIRSDYFALLAAFEDAIPQVFTHQIHLERLTEAQAVDAVIKPAERLGIQVDEPMVQIKLLPELLTKDGGIEPPLLQIVCDALYQHAQNDGRSVVDMRDYEAVGDVTGALGNYLHEKLRQFGKNQAAARAVLKALVTAEGTKRASFLPELCSRIISAGQRISEEALRHDYLDKFVRDRLVRVDDVEGQARYELSHDYLAKHIEVWIEESERELTKALELIDRAYETYQATRVLLERSALQALRPFEAQLALPPDKQAFLERSKTETRKQRRGLWLSVAAALMAVALIVGGGFGYRLFQSYKETQAQRDRALVEEQKANAARQQAEQQKELALAASKILTYDLVDALNRLPGTKPVLTKILRQNAAQLEQIYALAPDDPRAQREQAENLRRLGDLWMVLGNTPEALQNYQQALAIAERLTAANPSDTTAQRDLLISYEKLGDVQLDVNNITAALTAYQQELAIAEPLAAANPSNTTAQRDLALCYQKLGDVRYYWAWNAAEMLAAYQKALAIRERLAAVNPTDTDAQRELAISYGRIGNGQLSTKDTATALTVSQQAFAIRERLAAANPTNTMLQSDLSESYEQIGDVQRQMENTAAALTAYQQEAAIRERLTAADPTNMLAQRNLAYSADRVGDTYMEMGNTTTALTAYQQAFTIRERLAAADPTNTTVQRDLAISDERIGHVQMELGNMTAALAAYQQAFEIRERLVNADATNTTAQRNLAVSYEQIGDVQRRMGNTTTAATTYQQAFILLARIADAEPTHGKIWFMIGIILEKQEKLEDALAAYKKQVEVTPNHEDAWNAMGVVFGRQGKWDEALAAYKKQVEVKPNHENAWNGMGFVLEKQGKRYEAIAAYKKQVEVTPNHAWSWHNLGVQFERQGKWEEALAAYKKQAEVTPNHENAWYGMGIVFERQRKWDEALAAYKKQVEVKPNHENAWNGMGFVLGKQGKLDEALAAYKKQVEVTPHHANAWNGMGITSEKQGKWEEAITAFKKQVEVTPHHANAWNGMGITLEKQGKWEEAITAFKKQVEITPNHAWAWHNLGVQFERQGNWEEALAAYKKQAEVTPNHENAWYGMGFSLEKEEKWEEATVAYQKQLTITPEHKMALQGMEAIGKTSRNQGKLDEAIAVYRKIVEVKPNHDWAWNNMGFVLAQQGKLDEAIAAYKKHVEIKPKSDQAWNNLGNALKKQGKLDEAISAYQTQVEITPDHVKAWNNLGVAFEKQEKWDDAARAFADGLKLRPKNVSLLSSDAELALVQSDTVRCQTRIAVALPLVKPNNQLFAILPFYQWLTNPSQGWESVLTAIEQLEPAVKFTWSFDTSQSALDRLDADTQQAAQEFIAFFEGKIDLPALKTHLEGR